MVEPTSSSFFLQRPRKRKSHSPRVTSATTNIVFGASSGDNPKHHARNNHRRSRTHRSVNSTYRNFGTGGGGSGSGDDRPPPPHPLHRHLWISIFGRSHGGWLQESGLLSISSPFMTTAWVALVLLLGGTMYTRTALAAETCELVQLKSVSLPSVVMSPSGLPSDRLDHTMTENFVPSYDHEYDDPSEPDFGNLDFDYLETDDLDTSRTILYNENDFDGGLLQEGKYVPYRLYTNPHPDTDYEEFRFWEQLRDAELLQSEAKAQRIPVPTSVDEDQEHVDYESNMADQDVCHQLAWVDKVYPTCNVLHELNFAGIYEMGQYQFLGGGIARRVFLAHSDDGTEDYVLKLSALADYIALDANALNGVLTEAVVNGALSPHPRVVDMYNYCGLSQVGETMHKGDMHDVACPHYERCMDEELLPHDPYELRNDLSGIAKVKFALEMAKAVAVLHQHPAGRIIHNDITLAQFLVSQEGNLKIADFNLATVPSYDVQHDQYCKYRFFLSPGNAPEEYRVDPLDEKVDIYNLGTNFHALLTGVDPHFDVCEDHEVRELIMSGTFPIIDERWRNRSHAENALADLLLDMWAMDSCQRPNIRQVIDRLEEMILLEEKQEQEQQP